jgi:sortase A
MCPASTERMRLWLLCGLLLLGAQQLAAAGLIYARAALAPLLVERAWAATLARGGSPHKPWPWADTWPVARLQVPRLAIDQLVLTGATGNTLAFGPGLDAAGVAPGREGTAILAGHRDTHFRFLENLRAPMRLLLQLPDGRRLRYRVVGAGVVDSRRQTPAGLSAGPASLMLVTCYPFDALRPGGPLRYVVRAVAEPALPPGIQLAHHRPREVLHL